MDRSNQALPASGWVAGLALLAGVVSLFLPWVSGGSFFGGGRNAIDLNYLWIVEGALLFVALALVAVRLGYKNIIELIPSGPPQHIPNFYLWITLLCMGLAVIPGTLLIRNMGAEEGRGWNPAILEPFINATAYEIGPGAIVMLLAIAVLWMAATFFPLTAEEKREEERREKEL